MSLLRRSAATKVEAYCVQRERQFSSAMDTACLAATRSSASWLLNVDISVIVAVISYVLIGEGQLRHRVCI